MPGTILENLSNRKLFGVLSIIFIIQLVSFLIGAFICKCNNYIIRCINYNLTNLLLLLFCIAPAPSSPTQYTASRCVAQNSSKFSIPSVYGQKPENCREGDSHEQKYVYNWILNIWIQNHSYETKLNKTKHSLIIISNY